MVSALPLLVLLWQHFQLDGPSARRSTFVDTNSAAVGAWEDPRPIWKCGSVAVQCFALAERGDAQPSGGGQAGCPCLGLLAGLEQVDRQFG